MQTHRPTRITATEAVQGAAAGFAATIPMTLVMIAVQRLLPRQQQSTLEPRRVSDDLLKKQNLKTKLSEHNEQRFSVVAHFGYGAAMGALYALTRRKLPGHTVVKGPLFGMIVWTASYMGWLPAAGTLPPPHRRPAGRNVLLIIAHIVWGLAAALFCDAFLQRDTTGRVRQPR